MAFTHLSPACSRRDIIKAGALAVIPLAVPSVLYALQDQPLMTANGGTDPKFRGSPYLL
jgi:hypothetical protein